MKKTILKNITFWVILSGVLGYLLANLFGDSSWTTGENPSNFYEAIISIKIIFIQMLKMMIAPMIFFSLIGGLINIGEITKLKEMGLVTITYYISTTIIAIAIGLVAVFFIHPWENSDITIKVNTDQTYMESSTNYIKPKKLIDPGSDSIVLMFRNILSQSFTNPFESLVTNNILGIVMAALLIGLALLIVHPADSPLYQLVKDINIVINKILHWIILLTPIGVFAIVFDFSLRVSGDIFEQLFSFAALVFGATMLHGLIVLPLIAYFFGGVKPKDLFIKAAKPLLLALSTASSAATLPVSMQTSEEEFNVEKGVSGFVFPLGATMNMDGTALFEGIAAIFLAHLYGIDLSNAAIFSIFLMSMISSIGAPGMPSASMSGMQLVLLAAGIPLEAIGILLVIERPLDTFRTAVNVEGDMVGALVTQNFLNKRKKT